MKIPQGYKQSELGVIPEDWEIVELRQGLRFQVGFPFFSDYFNTDAIGLRLIRNRDLKCDDQVIFYSGEYKAEYIINNGDVLVGMDGDFLPCVWRKGLALLNQRVGRIITRTNWNLEFLFYLLFEPLLHRQEETGATTVKHLSHKDVEQMQLPIPPSKEQKSISQALSDVDALVAALDKKIAKKRLIKQGAMQQFLTGKKRLTRFSAPWVEKKIYEIGKLTGSGVDKKNVVGEQSIRLVNFLDVFREDRIFNKNLHFWTTASDNKIKTCNVLQGDVFFTPSSEMPYDIALSAVAMESMDSVCHSYHIYRLRFLEDIDLLYRAYMFKSNSFYEQANVACEGSGKRYVISLSKFNNLTVYYPSNKHEQRAIATILSDMDNEIADLEARRDKYKLIKRGMMQKLLTGQIRLIKPQAKVIPLAPQKPATKEIPVDAHIVAGHIVYKSHQSRGWGRTKLQKSLHLIGYIMQLNLGNEYIRNTAGPDDQRMMNYIDQKFKQFRHVNIIKEKLQDGRTHYSYTPTALIEDVEIAYERYPQDVREQIDALLDKLNSMDLAGAEILSTLYAVWNNRIIKGEQITDDLLISDFYAWSKHKAEFEEARVRKALDDIRIQNIIPTGWGQYIEKK